MPTTRSSTKKTSSLPPLGRFELDNNAVKPCFESIVDDRVKKLTTEMQDIKKDMKRIITDALKDLNDKLDARFDAFGKKLDNGRWGRKNQQVFAIGSGMLHLPHTSKEDEEWTPQLESAFPGRECDFEVWSNLTTNPITKDLAKYYGVKFESLNDVLRH